MRERLSLNQQIKDMHGFDIMETPDAWSLGNTITSQVNELIKEVDILNLLLGQLNTYIDHIVHTCDKDRYPGDKIRLDRFNARHAGADAFNLEYVPGAEVRGFNSLDYIQTTIGVGHIRGKVLSFDKNTSKLPAHITLYIIPKIGMFFRHMGYTVRGD